MSEQTLFSIHIREDEHGHLTVICESVGRGANAYELGFQILHDLKIAESEWPEAMTIAPFTYSELRH